MKAVALALLVASPLLAALSAQRIAGTVVDSVTAGRLSGVSVVVVLRGDPSISRSAITDGQGAFSIALPQAGDYGITVRRIGLFPLTLASVPVAGGETRAVLFEMTAVPVMLDTVRSEDRVYIRGFGYKLTSGQSWFAQHYRRGRGFFTSGIEIELSRLHACDYFGKVPGFRIAATNLGISGAIPCVDPHQQVERYVVPARPVNCLRTFVDRKGPLGGIDSAHFSSPGLSAGRTGRIPIGAIKGIEVFADPADIPRDLSYPMPIDARRCALILVWTTVYWGAERP